MGFTADFSHRRPGGAACEIWKTARPLFPGDDRARAPIGAASVVLDGELAIPEGASLSFDVLQMRLHPAESRIRKLAKETPAVLILFDLFVTPAAETLLDAPLVERRPHLERFHASIRGAQGLRLSPYTWSVAEARGWLEASGGAVDGVIRPPYGRITGEGGTGRGRRFSSMAT